MAMQKNIPPWCLLSRTSDGHQLCNYIVRNDAEGLRNHIRWLRIEQKPNINNALQAALRYAAALGDDAGIQVLVQEGAQVTDDMINVAQQRDGATANLPGVGGHAFAALYLKALSLNAVSAYTPLTRLRVVHDTTPPPTQPL